MGGHFRAFSFVDRIESIRPGGHSVGTYSIPTGIDDFPASLVAEAIGQLAAWSAMATVDFQRRPVAGIAGGIELLAPVHPGQTLELTVAFEEIDIEAAAYCGGATVGGVPVVRLTHCVGPMVPMEDFDNPEAVRERYALLCGTGAAPGGFGGLPPFRIERVGGEAGKVAQAMLYVPASAHIFADHFPRRPVFPGSLLMHTNLQLAAMLLGEAGSPAAGSWTPRRISDMKLRAFIPPGETLEVEARVEELSPESAELFVATRQGKRLAGSARVGFVPEGVR
jgi:3-hydroxymyristoyl/3-hydroxydecanoyl-(acyl carrier protein) dehydratase